MSGTHASPDLRRPAYPLSGVFEFVQKLQSQSLRLLLVEPGSLGQVLLRHREQAVVHPNCALSRRTAAGPSTALISPRRYASSRRSASSPQRFRVSSFSRPKDCSKRSARRARWLSGSLRASRSRMAGSIAQNLAIPRWNATVLRSKPGVHPMNLKTATLISNALRNPRFKGAMRARNFRGSLIPARSAWLCRRPSAASPTHRSPWELPQTVLGTRLLWLTLRAQRRSAEFGLLTVLRWELSAPFPARGLTLLHCRGQLLCDLVRWPLWWDASPARPSARCRTKRWQPQETPLRTSALHDRSQLPGRVRQRNRRCSRGPKRLPCRRLKWRAAIYTSFPRLGYSTSRPRVHPERRSRRRQSAQISSTLRQALTLPQRVSKQ